MGQLKLIRMKSGSRCTPERGLQEEDLVAESIAMDAVCASGARHTTDTIAKPPRMISHPLRSASTGLRGAGTGQGAASRNSISPD